MSRMSRNKGKRGEREAAAELNRIFGLEARRSQQYCGEAGDADLMGIEGIQVEVTRVERFHLHPALEQADNDRKAGEIPLVLTRQNGKGWVACCYLNDLPKIMDQLGEAEYAARLANARQLVKDEGYSIPGDESEVLAADCPPLDLDPKSPSQSQPDK